MIYVCDSCKFAFQRYSEEDQCPDCGKFNVREATEEEKLEFIKIQKEIKDSK